MKSRRKTSRSPAKVFSSPVPAPSANRDVERRLLHVLVAFAVAVIIVLSVERQAFVAPGTRHLQVERAANLAGRAYEAAAASEPQPQIAVAPAFNPFLQNLRDTSVVIGIIGPSSADFRVQWRPADGSFSSADEVVAQQGQAAGCSGCSHFFATITGLTPGTTYYYRVLDGATPVTPMGGLTAEEYAFTTDSPAIKTFRFAVGGDIGEPGGLQGDTVAFLKSLTPRPTFLLIPGDVAYDWGSLADYKNNFWPYLDDISPSTVIYPVPGNHDQSNIGDFGKTWSVPPWQGSGTLGVYPFSYGNLLVLNVDSGGGSNGVHSSSIETAMRSILAANQDKDWFAAQFHHPAKSCTYYGDSYTEGYFDTFDGAGGNKRVDFIFEGHAHTYERTKPLNNGGVAQNSNGPYVDPPGTISIVAGSPAKIATGSSTCGLTAHQEDTVGVLVVDVNCDTVTLTQYDTSGAGAGTVIDQTTVTKTGIACACGNGLLDPGETCDPSGNVGCGTGQTCSTDCSACTQTAVCGNGNVESGELCDGPNLGGQTCVTRGHIGGTLACAPSCTAFDESSCHDCGDGIKEDYEECDGSDFGGQTCASFGFGEGSLACTLTCTLDTSGCGYCTPTSPPTEVCDGLDNDCNGQIDENNVCCAASPEVCDGVDNDCDSLVDEDNVCCAASPEVCDGVDNDCDSLVDEDNVCCPGGQPNPEVCNLADDDCDSQVDEGGVCCLATDPCDGIDNDCDQQVDEGCCTGGGGQDVTLAPIWTAPITASPTSGSMRDVTVFTTGAGKRVVAGDKTNSRLLLFNPATRTLDSALSVGAAVTSVYPANSKLYAVGSGVVKVIEPSLTVATLTPTFSTPEGVAADAAFIYVGENTGNKVSKVSAPSPGPKSDFISSLALPTDLMVAGAHLHAGSESNKAVFAYLIATGAQSITYGAGKILNKPTGLTADGAGNLYVADGGSGGADKVFKYDASGTFLGQFGISGTWDPRGVWADEATGEFYIIDDSSDDLFAFDLAAVKAIGAAVCSPSGTPECSTGQAKIQMCGIGTCIGAKSTYCVGGYWSAWTACSGQAPPSPETCDGLDNDCDGMTDEGLRCRSGGRGSPLYSKAQIGQ